MGRISTIENIAASGLGYYNNLKIIVRGRPRFLDPQMDGGSLRFAVKRGFNFSALIPDNQSEISEDAYKYAYKITMVTRPSWMGIGTLIRIGASEAIGEMHLVRDTIDVSTIEVLTPLISNYSADPEQDIIPVVSLIGTPCNVFAPVGYPDNARIMTIDSWYRIVPSDVILLSTVPEILESLQEFPIKRAKLFGTRVGNPGIGEPPTVYQYHVELDTNTGLLPFVPPVGHKLYLKALPLYFRGEWGSGDLEIPAEVGPCVVDAFFGSLLTTNQVYTKLGLQTWDAFGLQANSGLTGDQQWQAVPENHLILERPITSDSLLFWQRITGNFQYQKSGFFQAELNSEGKFTFSTNLLVPKWPTDHEYGWVIPLFSRSAVTCVVQFEPQEQQVFQIPSNALTFIRPKVRMVYDTISTGIIPSVAAGDTILSSSFVCSADPIGSFTCSADHTLNQFTTTVPHGFVSGVITQFMTTGTMPLGIAAGTDYYVVRDSATKFRLSDTYDHAIANTNIIDITTAGSGILSCSNPNVNAITTNIPHGFSSGAKVQFTSTGTLPTGISANTTYYVVLESPITFRLSDTLERSLAGIGIISISSAGAGILRCSNPNANFISAGIKAGHYFSVSNIKYKIAVVTESTLTLTAAFPLSTDAVSYTILEQDLTPIDRILMSFKGSPNSRVEIRDWQYDGTLVSSVSYYILGTGEAYGDKRWLAGGFCVKPLFYNFAVLRARYSDGVSRYNAGHTYI